MTVGVTVRVVDPAFTSVTVHVKIWLLPAVNVTVLLGEVSVKLKAAPPSLSEATTLAKGIVDVPPPLFVTFIDNVAVELTVDAGKLMLVVPMPLLAELPLKVATDITSLEVAGGTVVDPKFAVISVDTANTSELTAIMHKNHASCQCYCGFSCVFHFGFFTSNVNSAFSAKAWAKAILENAEDHFCRNSSTFLYSKSNPETS